jgi:hypothetical protein
VCLELNKKKAKAMPAPFVLPEAKYITVPAFNLPRENVHDPCTINIKNQYGLEKWAEWQLTRPRINVDGVLLPNRPCDYLCERQVNQQYVGVIGQPQHNYSLVGGFLMAPQFYKNCRG